MSYQLQAQKRAIKGERVRREGQLPGVVYGAASASQAISLIYQEFTKLYKQAGASTLVDLLIDSAGTGKVIIQEVQHDPVSDQIIHVDLKRIDMAKKLRVPVTLKFVGESPAVKQAGGTLVTTLHTVEVECLPADLVSYIDINLDALKTFEEVIKVKDLVVPPGLKIVSPHADDLVAKVAAPLTEEEIKAMEEASKTPADLTKIEVAGEKEKAEAAAAKEAEGKPEAKKEEKSVSSKVAADKK